MTKPAAGKEKIQSFFAVPSHFHCAAGIQFPDGTQGQLDLERAVFDEEDVDLGRGRNWGSGGAGKLFLGRMTH
jgi:hypothetical protein